MRSITVQRTKNSQGKIFRNKNRKIGSLLSLDVSWLSHHKSGVVFSRTVLHGTEHSPRYCTHVIQFHSIYHFCIMIKDFSISFSRVIIVQDFETVTFYVLFVYKPTFFVIFC